MSSLMAEQDPIHVHVGGTTIMAGKPPKFEELLEHVEARLKLVPRFRQKIGAIPFGINRPEWIDDANFDLRWHVRHVALPKPGSREQLRELVGQVMSQALPFDRPLWQIYLIEGLKKGRFAVLSKTHHALVDGVSAVDIGTILLDPNPDGTEMEVSEERWDPDEPTGAMLFVRGATERVREPIRAARKTALGALTTPVSTATRVAKTGKAFGDLAARGPSVPLTSLNEEIGRDRRVAYVAADLQEIKDSRGRTDATVNDVILAVATGALRNFMLGRGESLPEHLVALVPVSIRREGEEHDLGNRISTILARLPVSDPDPVSRLEFLHAETMRLKQSDQALAASLIINATGWTPPTVNRLLSQAMERTPTWNLVVSNVPGPQVPFYLLGRKMLEVYPFVPLSPQKRALTIGVMSYNGGAYFGLTGDRDRLADLDDLARAVKEALAEQSAAALLP